MRLDYEVVVGDAVTELDEVMLVWVCGTEWKTGFG